MMKSNVLDTHFLQGLLLMLRAARPRQWLKNLLIFIPLLASHSNTAQLWGAAITAFLVFCLCASSAYLLNDVLDLHHDRTHPRKKNRPIASGLISRKRALLWSVFLGGGGLVLAGSAGIALLKVAGFYFILTIVYSLYFKRVLLLDVAVLAGLYTVRIIAGGMSTGIQLSFWLLSFSFFLFLSLALLKRHNELLRLKAEQQRSVPGRGYLPIDSIPVAVFGISSGMISTLLLLLYYNSGSVSQLYPNAFPLLFIVPLFFIWLARLWLFSFRMQIEEDPLLHVSTDLPSLMIIAMCIGLGGLATLL